ncbi:E3 ubiquitin-protein ligase [Nymphon striatum]|nr:E3 ubiquitin-protein ligase [Nymphon striatum]
MDPPSKCEVCVVCCKDIKVFAVGICDHPICHICSTRLRVLCMQNDCPICRTDLPKVYFSSSIRQYESITSWKQPLFNYKFKIYFENEMVQSKFWKLLDHSCQDLNMLEKVHEKFFCDLCIEDLNIFTHERKSYNRKDLARHRRIGDVDDTSYRGHPLCKFCDKRFMDNDILFKHLRRDHYFCHFCDCDGNNEYYGDYESLRNHYKGEHFLCEEDSCRDEKFTSVFRSDIDLKAHKSQEHSRNMSKAQAKQTRTLEIEFAIAPRTNQNIGVIRPSDYSDINRSSNRRKDKSGRTVPTANITTIRNNAEVYQNINTNCENEFPAIDGSSASADHSTQYGKLRAKTLANRLATNNRFTVRNSGTFVNDEEFPSLSSSVTAQPSLAIKDYSSLNGRQSNSKVNGPTARKNMLKVNDTEDFPLLVKTNPKNRNSSALPNSARNISIKINHKTPVSSSSVTNEQPKQNLISSYRNINLISADSVPVNDSGGNVKQMHVKSSRKVPDTDEKNFPALSSSATSVPLLVEGAWKTEKIENKTVPFVTIKSKKKKGKKTNNTEENKADSDNTKKKKKTDNTADIEITSNGFKPKTEENQENIKPSLDLSRLSLKSDHIEIDKNTRRNEVTIIKNNINVSKSAEDFPALGPSQTPRVPPPGFSSSVSHKISSAPPGFSLGKSSKSDPVTNVPSFTYTSSRGEDYSMTTTKYSFSQPNNFSERNKRLISTIKSVLMENNSEFDEFKKLSSNFRQDCLSAKIYYKKCIEIFGTGKFKKIISELMVLLPDIEKQQQLLTVHKSFLLSQTRTTFNKTTVRFILLCAQCISWPEPLAVASKGAKPKDNSQIFNEFVICTACRQVLSEDDFDNHVVNHNFENQFPSLPSSKDVNKPMSSSKY